MSKIEKGNTEGLLAMLRDKYPNPRPEGFGITADEYAEAVGISAGTARSRLNDDPDFEYVTMIHNNTETKVYTQK